VCKLMRKAKQNQSWVKMTPGAARAGSVSQSVEQEVMVPAKQKDAIQKHVNESTATLANILAGAQLNSSYLIVTAWCHYATNNWDDTLESLWDRTGSSDWKPIPAAAGSSAKYGVGSATLAQMLDSNNHGRYPKKVDQIMILGVAPNTLRGLGSTLGW
jgi:hypothetical protein